MAKTTILQPLSRTTYAANQGVFAGQNITAREPASAFPYLQQWNGNVQQAFGPSSVLQLAYLGARGQHVPFPGTFDINQIPDGAIVGASSQASRPYPTFQNVNAGSLFGGDTYYHSAQVTFSRRFRSGGTLLGNYSWSKFLSDTESNTAQIESHTLGLIQDFTNIRAERSYSSFDVPHRLVVSYIADLPVGRGKRFLNHAGDATNAAISGWNVTGINILQSGYPLAIIAAATPVSAAFGGGTPRPNLLAAANKA